MSGLLLNTFQPWDVKSKLFSNFPWLIAYHSRHFGKCLVIWISFHYDTFPFDKKHQNMQTYASTYMLCWVCVWERAGGSLHVRGLYMFKTSIWGSSVQDTKLQMFDIMPRKTRLSAPAVIQIYDAQSLSSSVISFKIGSLHITYPLFTEMSFKCTFCMCSHIIYYCNQAPVIENTKANDLSVTFCLNGFERKVQQKLCLITCTFSM